MKFLPTNLEEAKEYYSSFSQFDVIFVSGDPYYDHPLNGTALLARLLERKGYRVGIIPQPYSDEEYRACGRPKYFFCLTSGLLDSMLANYTPMLRPREGVLLPERALMVYTQKVKFLFPGIMTVLGGVEATIRRFTHFDYKDNQLRRGILNDTKADVLFFGNAERSLLELLKRLKDLQEGENRERENRADEKEIVKFADIKKNINLQSIDGAAYRVSKEEIEPETRKLPSYEECLTDKANFSLLTRTHYLLPESSFLEQCGLGWIKHNRPSHPLTEKEMDYLYEVEFIRKLHPATKNLFFQEEMVEKLSSSIVLGRGCWGSCNFCIIPLVQGKEIAKRSKESILKEMERLYGQGFNKIQDLTIATLNMYGSSCALYNEEQTISSPLINGEITVYNKTKYCNQQCVGCPQRVLRDDLLPLLEEVEKLQEKHTDLQLELRSAIRHDIILQQKELFRKIMMFTSRLKIAPEHISETVLQQMNKGKRAEFEEFLVEYKKINEEQDTHKNLVPYFVAAHPGCGVDDMKILRKFCDEKDIFVNLTQVFTPTPGTASTAAYFTETDTFTKKPVYVARTFVEKKLQKNLLLENEDSEVSVDDESG
ncbi:radical SAM protein [Candidatus Woesearchaeota archaeon]|nr:radical SAM protein [Candidatus Woesearchaeota archaeon]